MRRSLFAVMAMTAVLLAAMIVPTAGAQTGADFDIPGGHFYTQANGGAGAQYGYRITDEGGISFWSEFQRLGGVTALGYPASRRFTLNGFQVQATQKYTLQWRPEVSQVYFENVFDDLHNQGKDSQLQSQFSVPPPDTSNADQNARLGWLNADAGIAAKYGTGPGAIQAHGLPTSQVTTAGTAFKIIRNQRDAIQDWISAGPGGITPGTISIVNGGDVAKALGLVPSDAQITETSTGQLSTPAATPTPAGPAPTPTTNPSAYPFHFKPVGQPPTDCGSGNRVYDCNDSDPNNGLQYIQGHVLDAKGNGLSGYNVRMDFYGNSLTVGTEGDGLFTLILSNNCPIQTRVYTVYIVDGQGHQASDKHEVDYSNCNTAGVFHFDFVRNS